MELDEKLKLVSETGRIWESKWWLAPNWRSQISLSDDEIAFHFSILEAEFNETWVKSLGENLHQHPLVQWLYFGKDRSHLRALLRTADYLHSLKDLTGFNRVLKDFKTIEQNRSADMEMCLAYSLVKSGFNTNFVIPKAKKGKTPDIIATKDGEEFVVECKYLRSERAESWIRNYRIHFCIELDKCVTPGLTLCYTQYNSGIDIYRYGYPKNLVSPVLAAKIEAIKVVEVIKGLVPDGDSHHYKEIFGGDVLLILPNNDCIRGSIVLPDFEDAFLMRRLTSNGVREAFKQIEAFEKPGVAAVYQDFPADFGIVKKELDVYFQSGENIKKYLIGVLINQSQNLLKYIEPYWIPNPYFKNEKLMAMVDDTIKKMFNPIV